MSDKKMYGWWSETYLNRGFGTVWYRTKDGGKVEVCWVATENTTNYKDAQRLCEVKEWLTYGREGTSFFRY